MGGIQQFGLGEGVDGTGVTTKILSCNCSMNLLIENKSKLFGLHLQPPLMEMFFGRLPFAISRVSFSHLPFIFLNSYILTVIVFFSHFFSLYCKISVKTLFYMKWDINLAGIKTICWKPWVNIVQIVRGNKKQTHVWSRKKHAGLVRLWKWVANSDQSQVELSFSCDSESYQPKISSPSRMPVVPGQLLW